MGLFDFLKKKGVCWRDSDGQIDCPGDSCPQECDKSCPIWCHTLAVSALQIGQLDDAIALFNESLSIAPDYKESWVNMASIYGQQGNHIEANKAFLMAYQLDNNYANAIRGVIASYKNMGHFEEAFQFCDIFKNNVGDSKEAEVLRQSVREAQESGKIKRRDNDIAMAMNIISEARRMGILEPNEKMPHIPEIMVEKKRTCLALRQELLERGKTHKDALFPLVWYLWPIYAGIGAVYHWHIDWDSLQKKGIPQTLLEPRGVYAMDEYVLDIIGIGYDTEAAKKLNAQFQALALLHSEDKIDKNNFYHSDETLEFMQAMYIFGMVFEMERLGMR